MRIGRRYRDLWELVVVYMRGRGSLDFRFVIEKGNMIFHFN